MPPDRQAAHRGRATSAGPCCEAQRGEFPPPRSLNPAVEPALEAICLKAMALKPEDRYPSPRELADDIEVLLASDYEKLEQAHRDLHEAHEALKAAQIRMVQTEKLASLGQLVAGVVHEISNPLAFASTNVMVLGRDLGDIISLIGLYRQFEVMTTRIASRWASTSANWPSSSTWSTRSRTCLG